MSEKGNAFFTIGILSLILFIFITADFFNVDRVYSETEMRLLSEKPDYDWESMLSGEYAGEYEDYITDQFPGRDKLVKIKMRTDILSGRKEIDGVYIGEDGYLIEKHSPEAYTTELENEKLALLDGLVEEWNAKIMLVPTADNILSDKMPAYAQYYDEEAFLERVKERVGEHNYIDVYSVLSAHSDEEIYYRTDHHWTTLGAYYGYQAWTQGTSSFKFPYDIENMTTVSNDFQGTMYSKLPVVSTVDEIKIFPATAFREVSVMYDLEETTDTLYEDSYLQGKNQYGYFLDDNHAFTKIETDYHNGRTLFVIKDSYADSFIPLLQPHYETIYAVDLRYYNGLLFKLMDECEPRGGMDVLVLYNCAEFLDSFEYY